MLKEYRIKNGYTLEQVAELCDISWRNLVRIENDNYRYAKFETIAKLLVILKVPDKELINFIKDTAGINKKTL